MKRRANDPTSSASAFPRMPPAARHRFLALMTRRGVLRIAFTTVAPAAAIVVLLVGLVRAAGLERYDALATRPMSHNPALLPVGVP